MGGGGNDEDSKEGGHSIIVTICNMSMSTYTLMLYYRLIFRPKISLFVRFVVDLSESAKFWIFVSYKEEVIYHCVL